MLHLPSTLMLCMYILIYILHMSENIEYALKMFT